MNYKNIIFLFDFRGYQVNKRNFQVFERNLHIVV